MDKQRYELLAHLSSLEAQLKGLFGATYSHVVGLQSVKAVIDAGAEFTWDNNPAASKLLDTQLKKLAVSTQAVIKGGIDTAWTGGEEETTYSLYAAFGKTDAQKDAIKAISEKAISDRRGEGMDAHAFYTQENGGLGISSRVWNVAGGAKQELETIIQNGILEGKSADEVARSIKGYLNEPDRLYRRVRNKETDELELSKAAKDWKPGQGRYRSAYKNALRLARTEITMAYRRAEWESYQNNPLITGYRIELSNHHTTTNAKGEEIPLKDICDEMAGTIYPKTFLWTGWHPQCRCKMIPILVSDSDFASRMKALAEGKLNDWKASNTTTEMPKNFNDWVSENKDRIKDAKTVPYFIRDNYKDGDISKGFVDTIEKLKEVVTQAQKVITVYDSRIATLKRWAFALGGDVSQLDLLRYGGNAAVLGVEVERLEKEQAANRQTWQLAYSRLDLASAVDASYTTTVDIAAYAQEYHSLAPNEGMYYQDAIAKLEALKAKLVAEVAKEKAKAQSVAIKTEEAEDKASSTKLHGFIKTINEAADRHEVKRALQTQLRDTLGYDVKVNVVESMPLEVLKRYAKRYVDLCDTYTLEMPCTKLNFNQLKKVYGQVSFLDASGKATQYSNKIVSKAQNTGAAVAPSRVNAVATDKSRCDEGKLQISTLTHEFGHNLFITDLNTSANALAFRSALKTIRKSYITELNSCRTVKAYDDIYLGRYANKNEDEFLAEAFQEYMNRKNPSKYAQLVGELVDKHYKKKK